MDKDFTEEGLKELAEYRENKRLRLEERRSRARDDGTGRRSTDRFAGDVMLGPLPWPQRCIEEFGQALLLLPMKDQLLLYEDEVLKLPAFRIAMRHQSNTLRVRQRLTDLCQQLGVNKAHKGP